MKKLLFISLLTIFGSFIFASSYEDHIASAKKYEKSKQWVYALGEYYDAMACDLPVENKDQAYNGFAAISEAIKNGKPGIGKFNEFTIHDEWKNLLLDTEKYFNEYGFYSIKFNNLEKGDLDYTTKTATYYSKVGIYVSCKAEMILNRTVKAGYKIAYKEDWKDLTPPSQWPKKSIVQMENPAPGIHTFKYNGEFLNPFYGSVFNGGNRSYKEYVDCYLYDYKINIVDENGKELVKGQRYLLGNSPLSGYNGEFYENKTDNLSGKWAAKKNSYFLKDSAKVSVSGITPDIMEIIDDGKAQCNIEGLYIQYGTYNKADNNGGRTFIKNLKEYSIPAKNFVNDSESFWKDNGVYTTLVYYMTQNYFSNKVVKEEDNVEFCKNYITADFYSLVMFNETIDDQRDVSINFGGNPLEPVNVENAYIRVETFCNELSMIFGLEPAYTITYNKRSGVLEDLTINETANGYRVPYTSEYKEIKQEPQIYNIEDLSFWLTYEYAIDPERGGPRGDGYNYRFRLVKVIDGERAKAEYEAKIIAAEEQKKAMEAEKLRIQEEEKKALEEQQKAMEAEKKTAEKKAKLKKAASLFGF